MVMDFAERLKFVIKDDSVLGFAKKSGLSEGAIRKYLKGGEPGLDKVLAIANAAKVSVAWLATGQGPVTLEEAEKSAYATLPLMAPMGEPAIIKDSGHFSYNREWLLRSGYNLKNLATTIVTNDTMAPSIPASASIIFDRSQTAPANGLFVVSVNDWIEIRRLQIIKDQTIRVICDNEKYPAMDVDKHALVIAGRAVAMVHWQPL